MEIGFQLDSVLVLVGLWLCSSFGCILVMLWLGSDHFPFVFCLASVLVLAMLHFSSGLTLFGFRFGS